MKKFYITNEAAQEQNEVYFDFAEFPSIASEYIARTGGDPITDNDSDITLDELMEQASSEIMSADEVDMQYVDELCRRWRI